MCDIKIRTEKILSRQAINCPFFVLPHTRKVFVMRKLILVFLVFFFHQVVSATEVNFSSHFAPLGTVTLYDENGKTVFVRHGQGEISVDLLEGIYSVDFQDTSGMSAFSEDGRLMFVPAVSGAEIDIYPTYVSGLVRPLMRIATGVGAIHRLKSEILRRQEGDGFKHKHSGFMKVGMQYANHTFNGDTSAMRANMVRESSRAMTGGYTYSWPTGDVLGTFSYLASDVGAFNSMKSVYGINTSCRKTQIVKNYNPCNLTYGYDDALTSFSSQGGKNKGGQCKAFTNLVAYRSGVLHGTNWAWKSLPTDSSTVGYPALTASNIQAGDVIRRPSGAYSDPHGGIVVRVLTNGAVILDSNWVGGGNGNENIGTHVMSFTGTGSISDLGSYRRYTCVYTNNC